MMLDQGLGDLRNPADLDVLEQWLTSHSQLNPLPEIRDDELLPAHWFCIRGERLFVGPRELPLRKDSPRTA